jgi:4-amino-4-deoxy-L-arabinose transferase-like glycosyltransferase
MNILDTVLFGMLAGIITLKVALLATAAVLLLYGLTKRIRRRKVAPALAAARQPGLDVHA